MTILVRSQHAGLYTDYTGATVDSVVWREGRDSLTDRMWAPTGTITLVRDSSAGLFDIADVALGDRVYVSFSAPYRGQKPFGGEITDIAITPDVVRITAVASASRLYSDPYYTNVELKQTWKQGVDDLKASAFVAYVALTGGTIGKTDLWLKSQSFYQTTYAGFLDDLCSSSPSTVWWPAVDAAFSSTPYSVTLLTGEERKAKTSAVTLASSEILYDWRYELTQADKVTKVNVTAGIGGETTVVDFSDGATGIAVTETSIEPRLCELEAAIHVAIGTFGPRINPAWRIGTITVTNAGMTGARATTVGNALLLGELITIPSLVAGTPTEFFIEGITRTFTGPDAETVLWDLSLAARDLVVTPDAWPDVSPTLTWAATPVITWVDALQGDI